MKSQRIGTILCVVAAVGFSRTTTQNSVVAEDARYRVTFESVWSADLHPTDFPGSSAHFSPMVGATHTDQVKFWEPGQLATDGIESMAETGATGALQQEVDQAIADGTANRFIRGVPLSTSPKSGIFEFNASPSHSLVTLVSMIAPSPDWFVGIREFDLRPNGEWVAKHIHDLLPYDSGTDSGTTYRSANADTNPAEPISLLSGFPFENAPPLGTLTIFRLVPGDLNETGKLDSDDIDLLSIAIRDMATDSVFDLNDDGGVDMADHTFWIKDLANTFVGDANLDGEFNSSDLIQIFQHGEYEDEIVGNSTWATGDWNGDFEFDTGDLVAAFQDGGFETGPLVANAVPEPNAMCVSLGIFGIWILGRRKS